MIIVFHGQNITARKKALDEMRAGLKKKRPEAEHFDLDADEFTPARLEELAAGRGLFEEKYIVAMFNVLTIEAGRETVMEQLDALANTDHVFIIVEDKLSQTHKKKLSAYAESVKEFKGGADSREQKPFPLSDAYGRRDRQAAWIELQKVLDSPNNKPESIHGLLFWQTKLMHLAQTYGSAEEAGVSAYPFKKSTGFAKNFSTEELQKNTRRLVTMYHEAHRGRYQLADALEQFILEL